MSDADTLRDAEREIARVAREQVERVRKETGLTVADVRVDMVNGHTLKDAHLTSVGSVRIVAVSAGRT